MNSIMEGTEERISELGERTIEITQYEQQRKKSTFKKNPKNKNNRPLETFGTMPKDLTLVSSESQKERRNKAVLKKKVLNEIMTENFPYLGGNVHL